MDENWATFLVFSIGAVGLFSYLSVASWSDARRREREAFYRSEAIKKLSEVDGTIPDSVLQLLREALTPPEPKTPSPKWNPAEYRREQDVHHRKELLKSLAAMPGGGAEAALQYLREVEQRAEQRRREGIRLGGMITGAAGIGILISVREIVTQAPVYLAGLIPALVGLALVAYSYSSEPETKERAK